MPVPIVAQIITFGTMAARPPFRDVGRVMDLPYAPGGCYAKLVPMELKMTLHRALEVSAELKARYEADGQVRSSLIQPLKLRACPPRFHPRGRRGDHPRGRQRIRAPGLERRVPVTQFTMTTIEELGLLKWIFGPANPHGHQRRRGYDPPRDPDF